MNYTTIKWCVEVEKQYGQKKMKTETNKMLETKHKGSQNDAIATRNCVGVNLHVCVSICYVGYTISYGWAGLLLCTA